MNAARHPSACEEAPGMCMHDRRCPDRDCRGHPDNALAEAHRRGFGSQVHITLLTGPRYVRPLPPDAFGVLREAQPEPDRPSLLVRVVIYAGTCAAAAIAFALIAYRLSN